MPSTSSHRGVARTVAAVCSGRQLFTHARKASEPVAARRLLPTRTSQMGCSTAATIAATIVSARGSAASAITARFRRTRTRSISKAGST
jgi:hypothetical protein